MYMYMYTISCTCSKHVLLLLLCVVIFVGVALEVCCLYTWPVSVGIPTVWTVSCHQVSYCTVHEYNTMYSVCMYSVCVLMVDV